MNNHKKTDGLELYNKLAEFYDLINADVPFAEESELIRKLVAQVGDSSLLDVACGTGEHIRYVASGIDEIIGLDIADGMLDIARLKNPKVVFHKGDMKNFNLHRQFGVVCCLGSAIQYNMTQNDLAESLKNMFNHTCGKLVFDMRYSLDRWVDGYVKDATYENNLVRIHESWESRRVKNVSIWEPKYEIYDKLRGFSRTYQDRHVIKLYKIGDILAILGANGWSYQFVDVDNNRVNPFDASVKHFYFVVDSNSCSE